MTVAEIGVYVLLLCYDWNEGGIELNSRKLARYCRVTEAKFDEAWGTVRACFVKRDGRWWNPRLEREREKQSKFRAKQVAAGLASAAARSNHGSTNVQPRFNSPFPSPAQATTGRSRARNGEPPAPYRTDPFCPECGQPMGKLHPDDTKLVQLHAPTCSRRTE